MGHGEVKSYQRWSELKGLYSVVGWCSSNSSLDFAICSVNKYDVNLFHYVSFCSEYQ